VILKAFVCHKLPACDRRTAPDSIDNIITSCACVLYGLHTLRSHGMPPPAIHAVFQSTALAKVTYASPAWWGFTNAVDRNRLEAFIRRADRHGYCAHTTPTLSLLCDKADKTLFDNIITNSTHPLHILLPPKVEKHHSTRSRSGHCYQLPCKTSALDENNFFYCLLYGDILSFNSADRHFYFYCLTAVCLFFIKVLQQHHLHGEA